MSAVEAHLKAQLPEILAALTEFCAIPSVSTDPAYAGDVTRGAEFAADTLRGAGFTKVELVPTGGHPAVYAEWLAAPGAPTLLVYGHYDVQPPDPLEKWQSPPFAPEVRDGRLYARGASDDKGPLLIAIRAVQALAEVNGAPPVNLKFLIEGEEESGSPHFEPLVEAMGDRLACDCVVSADGAMWRHDLPSVMVAGRGLLAFDIHLEGAGRDLHSGRHGGSAPNPLRALVALLATLHDAEGRAAVPGFSDPALPPDPAIEAAIRAANIDSAAYFAEIGADLPDPLLAGEMLLAANWLQPTIEINGISGGYSGPGTKTVIPSEATAKITCRLVAGQTPDQSFEAISRHLEAHCPSGYRMRLIRHIGGCAAFALDPGDPWLALSEEVLGPILGAPPLRVAMGATVPIPAIFRRHLGVGTVFFSFSTSDEDYHAPNENFRLSSLENGLIAWARLLSAAAEMPATAR